MATWLLLVLLGADTVQIQAFTPITATAGEPVAVAVQVRSAHEVVAVVGDERLVMSREEGTHHCTIPGRLVRAPELSIRFVAGDAGGRVLAEEQILIPVEAPALTSAPPPAEPTSIVESWWFWTAIGVVAIGGAVAAGVAASTGGEEGEVVFRLQPPNP